jgi:hypothetical protein
LNFTYGVAQTKGTSTYELGKTKVHADPVPGEGNLIGVVRVLGKKARVPMAFIEMEGSRSIQADNKGKFLLTMEQGVYTVKIACSGYEDLVIEDLEVKEGVDQYINIKLATTNKGKFK